MTSDDKIRLAERVIDFVQESYINEDVPTLVGVLTKPQGINGFVVAEVGHPVFQLKDRYLIYLESINEEKITKPNSPVVFKKVIIAVPYYKETLSPYVKLNKDDTASIITGRYC